MKTHTILNIKTDKSLKANAKRVAEELGVPLSTVVNAFLKQFVRDKAIILSAHQHRPTPYLNEVVKTARKEFARGNVKTFDSADAFLNDLKK